MRVRVVFQVNTETGEVRHFVIEDISTEVEAEHDAVHDRIAHEIGKVVEVRPRPEQMVGGSAGDASPLTYRPDRELIPAVEAEEVKE